MECLLDESAVEGAAEVDATAASQSERVAVILQRMVAVAVPMPKLGALRMSDAQRLIPELYEHIPAHLRGYVAHEVRLDDEVAADTERLAAFGGCAVRGMPLSLFPKFYLRFAGRIALYHYCKQKCPEEADEILKRCCFTTSTAASARSKYASMLRYYGGSAGVDAIFCHAAAEQGKRPPAEHPNASKRRRMLYRSLLDFASRRAERSNFGTPIAPHEDLQERCPPPGSFIVMRPCGLQATDMARRGSSLAAGHTTKARTCRAKPQGGAPSGLVAGRASTEQQQSVMCLWNRRSQAPNSPLCRTDVSEWIRRHLFECDQTETTYEYMRGYSRTRGQQLAIEYLDEKMTACLRILPDYDGHARDRNRSPRFAAL